MSARPHLYTEALNLKFVNWLQLTQLDHLRAFFGFLQYFSLLSCAFPSPRSEKMVEWRPSVFP